MKKGERERNVQPRMTRQRRIILEELAKLTSHPTADELYRIVRRRIPRISLGTVYRNLELLSRQGTILKLDTAGTQKRFDADTKRHYHVECSRCGRVADVTLRPQGHLERAIRSATDYVITGHCISFVGLCPKCQAMDAAKERRKGAGFRERKE